MGMESIMSTFVGPVVAQSKRFRDAFGHGMNGKPVELTENNLVYMVRRTVNIALDDGEISEEQLRYEVGLLVGTLLAARS
jgi:hypothetical protein